MDTTNYTFPLFESLLHGILNPLLAENADGIQYIRKSEEQISLSVKKSGVYRSAFPHSFNLKTKYYARLIIRETEAYITDMCEMIRNETISSIRSYYRDQILDKHLTNCLSRLGRHLRNHHLLIKDLINPDACNDNEKKSNVYVLHLLKVCVAKAYLEIQLELRDVVNIKLTENQLYASVVNEDHPVQCFLRIEHKVEEPVDSTQHVQQTNSMPKQYPQYCGRAELLELLQVSESTLLRYQKEADFPRPTKQGRNNYYNRTEVEVWKANFKAKS